MTAVIGLTPKGEPIQHARYLMCGTELTYPPDSEWVRFVLPGCGCDQTRHSSRAARLRLDLEHCPAAMSATPSCRAVEDAGSVAD